MHQLTVRLALASLLSASLLTACGNDATTLADRQADVREARVGIMPFDLDKTMHSFVKTSNGGVQKVVVLDPADVEQVRLIREHLEEISTEFAAGRFSDPRAIHGDDMPGLSGLAAGAADLQVS